VSLFGRIPETLGLGHPVAAAASVAIVDLPKPLGLD